MSSEDMNNYVKAAKPYTTHTTNPQHTAPSRPIPSSSGMSDLVSAMDNTSVTSGTDAHLSNVSPKIIGTEASMGLDATSSTVRTAAAVESSAVQATATVVETAAAAPGRMSRAVSAVKDGGAKGLKAVKGGGKWMGKAALIGGGVTAALIAAPTVINWLSGGGPKRQQRVSAEEINANLPPMAGSTADSVQMPGGAAQGDPGQWAARIQAEQQAAANPTLPGGRG